jgi:hypothetical protein
MVRNVTCHQQPELRLFELQRIKPWVSGDLRGPSSSSKAPSSFQAMEGGFAIAKAPFW